MSIVKLNQRGAIDIILILVFLVLAAGLGGYVYMQQRAAQRTYDSAGNGSTVTRRTKVNKTPTKSASTTKESSFDVTDLGVKFILPASLSDLTYQNIHLPGDQAVNSVEFGTKKLEGSGCSLSTAPLGMLTYDLDQGGSVVAHARGGDLYYIKPTGQCGGTMDWQTLETALKTLVAD